ncbi:hypothetical protein HDU96_005339 [Phlyctochytrium bullatum]|nr:hypothetical protein HDU96_005339 [Phlyctochytrium bullatum]
MKFTAIVLFASALFTSVNARFAQEQAVGLGGKVSASGCFKNGDTTGGFGGQEIQNLLAATDPCAKLTQADALIAKAKATCGNDAAALSKVVAAAMDLVVAEKNFNPFNGNKDSVCTKPNLPASPELQGLIQLVDPRTAEPNNKDPALAAAAARINAKAKQLLDAAKAAGKGPGGAQGRSLADLVAANGLAEIQNFNGQAAPVVDNNNNNNQNNNNNNNNQNQNNNNNQQQGGQAGQADADKIAKAKQLLQEAIDLLKQEAAAAAGGNAGNAGDQQQQDNNAGQQQNNNNAGQQQQQQGGNNGAAALVGAGTCSAIPTIDFIVNGNEHRFGFNGQQVALNPGVVVGQVCGRGGEACRAPCEQAGAALVASGARGFSGGNDPAKDLFNAQQADIFNAALGNPTNVAGKFQAAAAGAGNNNGAGNGGNGGNGGSCKAQGVRTMEYIIRGQEHRFGVDGNQVALNPAIVVQQICDRAQGECQTRCRAAGDRLIAKGVRGFSGGQDAAKDAANKAAADAFNAELGV